MSATAKLYISLAVALIIGVGVTILGGRINTWHTGYLQNKERGQVIKTTSGIIADNDAIAAQGDAADAGVDKARDDYQRGYDDAKRKNPAIATRDERAVPVELRKLAHERRIARERSGRPLVGSEAGTQATPAPER